MTWTPPATGRLKLNFDRNCLREVSFPGYDGVIRNDIVSTRGPNIGPYANISAVSYQVISVVFVKKKKGERKISADILVNISYRPISNFKALVSTMLSFVGFLQNGSLLDAELYALWRRVSILEELGAVESIFEGDSKIVVGWAAGSLCPWKYLNKIHWIHHTMSAHVIPSL